MAKTKTKVFDVSAEPRKKKKKVRSEEEPPRHTSLNIPKVGKHDKVPKAKIGAVKKKLKVKRAAKSDLDFDYAEDPVFAEEYESELKPKKKKRKEGDVEPSLPDAKKLKKKKKLSTEQQLAKLAKAKTDLLNLQSDLPHKLSRTDTKGMTSIVGEHAEQIHQRLEGGDVDGATDMIRVRMLQAMVDVIPFIENNIRQSGGKTGSYHLKSLYECIASILSEMQAMKDRDAIAMNYVANVLQPFATQIANNIIIELNNITTDLRPFVKDTAKQELNKALNDARTRMGQTLQGQYSELKTTTLQYLQTNA